MPNGVPGPRLRGGGTSARRWTGCWSDCGRPGERSAAVAAGALFVGVQVGHPPLDVDSITTAELAIRNTLTVLMAALALAGITGRYLSQVRRNGVLGLIGYLVLALGYLLITSSTFGLAYVLPSVAGTDTAVR